MVSRHTVTLANSIVGVSVLAMPFCFKQCGIVLATLSLMTGAIMTRMVCYFLLKAAVMSRRRTYEMLAWSTFGHTGKFMVEISIIGFLFGTLIAFMVVIGDLGPEILSEMFSMENNSSLRTIIMTALSLFVALPLGLLRNIDSLSSVSTASVLFYLFLVLKIFSEGIGPLWTGEYLERIHFWKSGGVLQCIPIFSMALSCQTQIFGIYDTLAEPSLQKMNEIVKQAVNICTFFYFCVGFFGYIAFSQHNFGGNILLSFSPTWSTQLIKSMFLMSVVFSVPLVVFPCRASLHSMIFRSGSTYHQVHDMSTNYIPEARMKFLTVTIVAVTLIIGILIPNIELVLGLVGSTTGSVICIIFPSIMFVRVTSKNTTERLLAQGMFCIGVVLMLLTTYATLYAAEQAQSQVIDKIPEPLRVTENLLPLKPVGRENDVQLNSPLSKLEESKVERVEFHKKLPDPTKRDRNPPGRIEISSSQRAKIDKSSSSGPVIKVKSTSDTEQLKPPVVDSFKDAPRKLDNVNVLPVEEFKPVKGESSPLPLAKKVKLESEVVKDKKVVMNNVMPSKDSPTAADKQSNINAKDKKEFVDKQVAEAFLKKLEEHQENQKKLLEEQKEILEELKQHHAQDVREKIEKEKQADKVIKEGDKPALKASIDKVVSTMKQKPNVVVPNNVADTANIVAVSHSADTIMREQEKIIEKISENIEKENKNAQLLEKFEEGLNKEVQMMNAQKNNQMSEIPSKVEENIPPAIQTKVKDNVAHNIPVGNAEYPKSKQIGDDIQKLPREGGVVDIEKGVLVGSFNTNQHDKVEVPQKIVSEDKKPVKDDSVRTNDNHNQIKENIDAGEIKSVNVEHASKKATPVVSSIIPKKVLTDDITKNKLKNDEPDVPVEKKPVSVKAPKEKIDREI